MSKYVLYRDDIETIEPDETETHAKIIEVMSVGLENIMANYAAGPSASPMQKHMVFSEANWSYPTSAS